MPAASRPGPLVLGHRGAPRAARENTLEAFTAARDQGADGVELDVHTTADGVLVVHHDPDIPALGLIGEATHAQVLAAAPYVPTLDDVLDAIPGLLVNVEVKNLPGDPGYDPEERTAAGVAALVARRGIHDSVVVSSFGIEAVDRVHALDPAIPTGFLFVPNLAGADALALAVARGHRAIHPCWPTLGGDAGRALVADAHAAGVQVNVWTVNDVDVARGVVDAGVDAVITDVPAEMRTWLGA